MALSGLDSPFSPVSKSLTQRTLIPFARLLLFMLALPLLKFRFLALVPLTEELHTLPLLPTLLSVPLLLRLPPTGHCW
jgi:hypothetical protein